MPDEMTLLLVDDDETTRQVLTLMLGAEGWHVREAASGEDALRTINAADVLPAVVLSDLRMPGLCGSDMAQAIRQSLAARGPVQQPLLIAMTATASAGTPAGFDDLLIKPFSAEEVLSRCKVRWDSRAETLDEASTEAMDDATGPAEPVLSVETLERLRAGMPAAQLRSLYDFALQDAETRVALMQTAAAAGDDAMFRREAHAMKGSCGMIGARQLGALAARAEQEGIPGSPALTESKPLTEFMNGIARIRHMLERLLQD